MLHACVCVCVVPRFRPWGLDKGRPTILSTHNMHPDTHAEKSAPPATLPTFGANSQRNTFCTPRYIPARKERSRRVCGPKSAGHVTADSQPARRMPLKMRKERAVWVRASDRLDERRTCSLEYATSSMKSMCFDLAALHPGVRT